VANKLNQILSNVGSKNLSDFDPLKIRIKDLVGEITRLHGRTENLTTVFVNLITQTEDEEEGEELFQSSYWEKVVYRNALIKLRLILEQNFKFVETLGLLAVTRYIFELLVWVRTIRNDTEYSLVFYGQVIENHLKHLQQFRKKLESEADYFDHLGELEGELFRKSVQEISEAGFSGDELANRIAAIRESIEEEIDRRAKRNFCTQTEQAKHNGYSFHAHLIRTKGLVQIDDQIAEISLCQKQFAERCDQKTAKTVVSRWDWSKQAKAVGMELQYDFIYRSTSRLLHATPVSVITNQKNLELEEMVILLEYIHVSVLDILELCESATGKPSILN
jgi:hypothetical protein